MVHRLQLPRRTFVAALMAALAAFIAVTAIAPDRAAAAQFIYMDQHVGSPQDVKDPFPAWSTCAQEGQICQINQLSFGKVLARYGDTNLGGQNSPYGPMYQWGKWEFESLTDGFACTNQVFGDPFQNRAKHCDYDRSGYELCASEGGTCVVPAVPLGYRGWWARYGAVDSADPAIKTGRWMVGPVQAGSSFVCRNETFARDPFPNRVKACWIGSQ